jgi:hypothetical protein
MIFILYLNEFKESKYLNGVENFLLNISFELWKFSNKSIISKKFIQKDFLLSTFIQKGLQKFLLSLIGSKFQHPFIALLSVTIKVFLY